MTDSNFLLDQATKAIADFESKSLSLGGLVNRLESIRDALADAGIELGEAVDKEILQLEIINSLVASGDQDAPSNQDLADIDSYLRHIGNELRGVYHQEDPVDGGGDVKS